MVNDNDCIEIPEQERISNEDWRCLKVVLDALDPLWKKVARAVGLSRFIKTTPEHDWEVIEKNMIETQYNQTVYRKKCMQERLEHEAKRALRFRDFTISAGSNEEMLEKIKQLADKLQKEDKLDK